jgi:hypothetical protein
MITAVAQTLAELLVEGSSLIQTVSIDLSHPRKRRDVRPALSLYLYDIRKSIRPSNFSFGKVANDPTNRQQSQTAKDNSTVFWYDLSFIIVSWDWTNLGEQRLLSEVLLMLLKHRLINEKQLPNELKGYGDLSMEIATAIPDVVGLWKALGLPLQPALYITIQTPFNTDTETNFSQIFRESEL